MAKLCHITLLLAAPLSHAMQWDWEYRGHRLPEQAHPCIELRGDAKARPIRDDARKMEESIAPLYVWWRDGKRPEAFWEEAVYEGAFESDAKTLYAAREQLGEMIDEMAGAAK